MSLKFKTYPNSTSPDGSYTAEEVRKGYTWLHTDVTCPHCDKLQSLAMTGYVGGPCIKCGKPTSGEMSTTAEVTES